MNQSRRQVSKQQTVRNKLPKAAYFLASLAVTGLPFIPGIAFSAEETNLDSRILVAGWLDDLVDHMRQHFSRSRQDQVGKPDLSTNMWDAIIRQLSVLYDRPAVIRHEDAEGAELATALLAEAGWPSLSQSLQRVTLGCREAFVRPTLASDGVTSAPSRRDWESPVHYMRHNTRGCFAPDTSHGGRGDS